MDDQRTETSAAPGPLMELRGITKGFPGVLANDRVDLDLYPGEVHALLGENGAGKSTLISILAGMYHPDAGTISVAGEPARIESPREAIERGIGTVYQHLTLVPTLSVIENLMLGSEGGVGTLDVARARERFDMCLCAGRLGVRRPNRRNHQNECNSVQHGFS